MTEPITATEHFVAQSSDITTASHAWLKPHNGCVFAAPLHSFTSSAPYGKERNRRWFMKYEMRKEKWNDGPVCLSITAEGVDESPEGAAVSLPFIPVKFSTPWLPGTPCLLMWAVNRSGICACA